MSDQCRACHAPVIWGKSHRGNPIIMDAKPLKVWAPLDLDSGVYELVDAHMDHHATCTDPRRFDMGRRPQT